MEYLPDAFALMMPALTKSAPRSSKWRTSRLVTSRRWDLAVKYRLFKHLLGGDDIEAESLYDWHIMKRSGHRMKAGVATDINKMNIEDYRRAATRLFLDMERNGFRHEGAIPVDVNGELLGGAHRVACALALGISCVPVHQSDTAAWAPPWGESWFREHGMSQTHIEELRQTMAGLTAK